MYFNENKSQFSYNLQVSFIFHFFPRGTAIEYWGRHMDKPTYGFSSGILKLKTGDRWLMFIFIIFYLCI